MQLHRGDIFWVELHSEVSHIQRGRRPVIVVTNDKANTYSPYVYVVPFTTRKKKYMPTHVEFFMNNMWQTILCENIIPVAREEFDGKQLVRRVDSETMRKVDRALMIELGLNR